MPKRRAWTAAPERWQLEGGSAELYERYLVPPVTLPWAVDLVEQVGVEAGDRVLDVARGTGDRRVAATFDAPRLLLAVQLYERVEPGSLADVVDRCDWSSREVYAIDPPGRNHGLLLGGLRWSP